MKDTDIADGQHLVRLNKVSDGAMDPQVAAWFMCHAQAIFDAIVVPPVNGSAVWGHALSSRGEDGYTGSFATREDAVKDGIGAYGESFYVVRGRWFDPATFFDPDTLFEAATERIAEDCPEGAELTLRPGAAQALGRLLDGWARRYVQAPAWQADPDFVPEFIDVEVEAPESGEAPALALCPWCREDGDLEVLDADKDGEDEIGEKTISAAVYCQTCTCRGPLVSLVSQGCHDPEEDGPLAESLHAAAIAAWNELARRKEKA